MGRELEPKRLELLREVIPTATKIGLLVNLNSLVTSQDVIQRVRTGARSLGLEIIVVSAGTENEIESAFSSAVQQRVAVLNVSTDAYLNSRRKQIAALALRHALPTISSHRESAAAGMLMSYGANQLDLYRQAGTYVGRILKGEKPRDLPVLQPTKFELVINLKTAKALGIAMSPMMLARADEAIE